MSGKPDWEWDLRTDHRGKRVFGLGGSDVPTFTRPGTPTYIDPITGLVTIVSGADVGRFELVSDKLLALLEPTGKNWITYSSAFRAAISAWSNVQSTVSDDAATGPDGNATADKIVVDGNTGAHYVRDTIAKELFTDDASVTFSGYLAPSEVGWVRIGMRNKVGTFISAFFNLATGAVGTEDVDSYGSEQAANGFWRFWITHDIGNGGVDPFFQFVLADANDDDNITGDSTSGIYAWGAQVEESTYPTSLIPTSGATATRTTESGMPYYTVPTGIYAEALGAEEATGTLIIGNVYKITADDGNHFYVGSVTGEYFQATAETALDATNKVQQVTNAYNSNPPESTTVMLWRPGYDYSDIASGNHGIVSVNNSSASVILNQSAGKVSTYDGITTATVTENWASNTLYKIAVQVAVNSNVYQFRIGIEPLSSTFDAASWGSWFDYDGAFTVSGNGLQFGYSMFGRMHVGHLGIWKRVVTDPEVNAW